MPSTPEIAPPEALPADRLKVDRALEPLRKALRVLGLVLLGVLISTPALQVVMRQLVGLPMIGAEELSRFMLISTVMLTVPYTVSSGASIRMPEIVNALPTRLSTPINVLIATLGFAAFAFASYSVFTATLRNLNNATPTLGIPYFVFFSATAVGFLMAAVEYAAIVFKGATGQPLYVTFAAEQPDDELVL